MGKSFTFSFFDRNRNTDIRYLATYDTDLSIDIICETYERSVSRGIRLPHVEKREKAVDPWAVFHEHATFDSILRGLSFHSVRTRQDTRNETNGDYLHTWKATGVMDSGIPILTDSHAAFLRGIADNPDRLLYNDEALHRFVRLLWAAKTGDIPPYIRETREEIKEILKNNLVPKHRSGAKYRPQGTEAARMLLKALASHLSERCLTLLKRRGLDPERRDTFNADQAYHSAGYDALLSWGGSNETKIVWLNKRQLYDLMHTPSDYADQLLEEALKIGLRTINKRSAK